MMSWSRPNCWQACSWRNMMNWWDASCVLARKGTRSTGMRPRPPRSRGERGFQDPDDGAAQQDATGQGTTVFLETEQTKTAALTLFTTGGFGVWGGIQVGTCCAASASCSHSTWVVVVLSRVGKKGSQRCPLPRQPLPLLLTRTTPIMEETSTVTSMNMTTMAITPMVMSMTVAINSTPTARTIPCMRSTQIITNTIRAPQGF